MKHARADYKRIQDPAGLIPEDEPVFLLRGQDPFAANVVRQYVTLLKANGVNPDFVQMCQEQANAMDAWPNKLGSPDLPKEALSEPADEELMGEDASGDYTPDEQEQARAEADTHSQD